MGSQDIIQAGGFLLEAIMYFTLFEAFLRRKISVKRSQLILGVIGLTILIDLFHYVFQYSMANLAVIAFFSLIIMSIFYQGSIGKKIMVIVLAILISVLTEGLVCFSIASFFNISVTQAAEVTGYWVIGILVSKLLGIACCNAIRIKLTVKNLEIGYAFWLMFFLLFGSALFSIFLIGKMAYALGDTRDYIMLELICTLGLFSGAFYGVFLYERLVRQSEAIREQEQYDLLVKTQERYFNDMLIKQEDILKFRHDIINQLIAIKGFFMQRDYKAGEDFVETLTQDVSDVNFGCNTGNLALDAIISTKKAVAERKGCHFELDVNISPSFAIEPVDTCVIFGNALDNAIEACERLPDGQREIALSLVQRKNAIYCAVSNTTAPDINEKLITSKPDAENHGFGLINIEDALKKYDSEPEFSIENGRFCLSFMIFI